MSVKSASSLVQRFSEALTAYKQSIGNYHSAKRGADSARLAGVIEESYRATRLLAHKLGFPEPPEPVARWQGDWEDWHPWVSRVQRYEDLTGRLTPPKKATGRRKKTDKTSGDETLAWLCDWHKYDEGRVTNYEPATNRKLHEFVKERLKAGERGIAPNALTRFLEGRGGMKAYKAKCVSESIGPRLAFWRGEVSKLFASPLLPHESGRNDDD